MSNKHQNEIFLDKVKEREWKSNRLFKPFAHCDFFTSNEKLFLSELDDYLRMRTQEEKEAGIINYHIHPSVQTIADNLGMGHDGAEEIRDKLIKKGALKKVPQNERPKNAKGNQKYYYLVYHSCFETSIDFKNQIIADRNKETVNTGEWEQINKWLRAFSKAAKKVKNIEEFVEMIHIFKAEYKKNIELTPIALELESKGFKNKEMIEELKKTKVPKSNVVKGNFQQESEPIEKMEVEPVPEEEFDYGDFNEFAQQMKEQQKAFNERRSGSAAIVSEEVMEEKKTTPQSSQETSVFRFKNNVTSNSF